jgi:hypothetical protein
MSSIVAGRFDTLPDAERAARALYTRGFSVWDVSIFSVGGDAGTGRASRPAGVLLSARAEGELTAQAVEILRAAGARDLERAEGRWENGRWTDFDPGAPPLRMEEGDTARGGATGVGAAGNGAPGQAYDSAARGTTGPDNERSGQLGAASVAFNETGNEDPGAEIDQAIGQRAGPPAAPSPAPVQGEDNTVEPGNEDDAAKGAQQEQAEQGTGSRRKDWEQAASYRPPEERDSSPELVRGATTTPEPQDDKDIDRKVRRGESPPGVGEQQLRDPGNATPGAPPVDNRS